jgi:hypothetical protein
MPMLTTSVMAGSARTAFGIGQHGPQCASDFCSQRAGKVGG